MNKIPTIFLRDPKDMSRVTGEWNPECTWVRDEPFQSVARRKYDGACCMIRGGKLFKRRELKKGQSAPAPFELVQHDPNTGKSVGWMPVTDDAEDRWFMEAFAEGSYWPDGTYELLGPKINANKDRRECQVLQMHKLSKVYWLPVRSWDSIRMFLMQNEIEGLVFHHDDGRMAKIKRRDFGFSW